MAAVTHSISNGDRHTWSLPFHPSLRASISRLPSLHPSLHIPHSPALTLHIPQLSTSLTPHPSLHIPHSTLPHHPPSPATTAGPAALTSCAATAATAPIAVSGTWPHLLRSRAVLESYRRRRHVPLHPAPPAAIRAFGPPMGRAMTAWRDLCMRIADPALIAPTADRG